MKIEGSACIGFECLTRNRIEIICGYSTGGGLVNNTAWPEEMQNFILKTKTQAQITKTHEFSPKN